MARRAAKPEPINEALREHVTSIGFDLSLRKTQIAALVVLDLSLQRDGYGLVDMHLPRGHRLSPAFGNFVTGAHGLQRRGLITHTMPKRRPDGQPNLARDVWSITTAGACVIGLLKEAGIYQEFAEALTQIRAVS